MWPAVTSWLRMTPGQDCAESDLISSPNMTFQLNILEMWLHYTVQCTAKSVAKTALFVDVWCFWSWLHYTVQCTAKSVEKTALLGMSAVSEVVMVNTESVQLELVSLPSIKTVDRFMTHFCFQQCQHTHTRMHTHTHACMRVHKYT